MKYNINDFFQLIDTLVTQFDFKLEEIHNHIFELKYEFKKVMRLIFDEDAGHIILSFNVDISKSDSIQLYAYIKNLYSNIAITQDYYENGNGTYFDDEAYEQKYADEVERDTVEEPSEPVSYVVKYATYEASHPMAKVVFEEFKNRKKMF
jgi:regulator of RNase E activity RraB